jgi:hypothetical protein
MRVRIPLRGTAVEQVIYSDHGFLHVVFMMFVVSDGCYFLGRTEFGPRADNACALSHKASQLRYVLTISQHWCSLTC